MLTTAAAANSESDLAMTETLHHSVEKEEVSRKRKLPDDDVHDCSSRNSEYELAYFPENPKMVKMDDSDTTMTVDGGN